MFPSELKFLGSRVWINCCGWSCQTGGAFVAKAVSSSIWVAASFEGGQRCPPASVVAFAGRVACHDAENGCVGTGTGARGYFCSAHMEAMLGAPAFQGLISFRICAVRRKRSGAKKSRP